MNQLGKKMEGDIIRIATLKTLDNEDELKSQRIVQESNTAMNEALIPAIIPVYYANGEEDIMPAIQFLMSTEDLAPDKVAEKVQWDARNKQILMHGTSAEIEMVKAIVRSIDKMTPQVLIEARVVEAATTFRREIGFDWGTVSLSPTDRENWAETLGGALDLVLSASNLPNNSAGQIGFNFTRVFGMPWSIIDARLQASESQGNTKTLAAPKIVTTHDKEATIKQGFEYPYNTIDSSGNTITEFKEVNLELAVTPRVMKDNRIGLKIRVTKEDVIDETAAEPALSTNEAVTELLVNDGDTIVIGGVIRSSMTEAETGLPGLRSVPLVGWLFKSSDSRENRTELLIFITPKVVHLEEDTTS
jgi:type IV pilus assembly protein PilQ